MGNFYRLFASFSGHTGWVKQKMTDEGRRGRGWGKRQVKAEEQRIRKNSEYFFVKNGSKIKIYFQRYYDYGLANSKGHLLISIMTPGSVATLSSTNI